MDRDGSEILDLDGAKLMESSVEKKAAVKRAAVRRAKEERAAWSSVKWEPLSRKVSSSTGLS